MHKKVALASVVFAGTLFAASNTPRIVGYFESSSNFSINDTGLPPRAITREISHNMIFSISLDSVSNIGKLDAASWGNLRVANIVDSAHADGRRACIVIGGWGISTKTFTTVSANASYRLSLASDIRKYVQQNNLDCVDLDYEYPSSYPNFLALCQAIHDSISTLTAPADSKPVELSIAVNPAASASYGFSGQTWNNAVDFFNLMAYDDGPPQAPMSDTNYLATWTNALGAATKTKMVIGLPFYGEVSGSTTLPYASIVAAGGVTAITNSASANGSTYYFNGVNAVSSKTKSGFNYGGVMTWQVNQDVWIGDTLSLLRAMRNTANQIQGISSRIPLSSFVYPSSSSAISSSSINYPVHTNYSCPTSWVPVTIVSDTASTSFSSTSVAKNAFDGDSLTYWEPKNASTDWIQFDLGSVQSVSQMHVTWFGYYWESQFAILGSVDGVTWDTTMTEYYDTSTATYKQGYTGSWTPANARYIRFQDINPASITSRISEIKFYGCSSSASAVISPVQNWVNLSAQGNRLILNLSQGGYTQIEVHSTDGKISQVLSQDFQAGDNNLNLNLQSGVWFLVAKQGNLETHFRVVTP